MRNSQVIAFLDILRGPAALLVVWSHWIGFAPSRLGFTPTALSQARAWINYPLGIIQDFGWLGVCLFFLISGFIITHVAQRESRKEFLIKRVFRIYPLLALAVLLAILLQPEAWNTVSVSTVASNAFLLNYFFYPQITFVQVAWTLAVEVLFYALLLSLYPFRGRADLLVTLELAFVLGIIALSPSLGHSFFLLAAAVAYLPYLIVGQLFYFGLYTKRLHPVHFLLFLAGCLFVLVVGLREIHTGFLSLHNSYLISFGWAVILFLIGLLLNAHLFVPRFFSYLAYSSYTIYLLHDTVGDIVLKHFFPSLGYSKALLMTAVITGSAIFLVYRWYERPMLRLGHKLASRI